MSTKDDIFNYVMKTPENTNPAVLKDLLNGIEGGGSAGPLLLEVGPSYEYPNLRMQIKNAIDNGRSVYVKDSIFIF